MPPEAIVTNSDAIIRSTTGHSTDQGESLFEHVAWLYAFCREKVFRDDTNRIIAALWSKRSPDAGEKVIELGCGPGFYSRNLAQRFPQISVTGVDRSEGQILRARRHARDAAIENCAFEQVNALQLPCEDASFDVLIASRLFTILYDPKRAVAEMYRVLRRDGRCFIAEPRYAIWASIPLFTMWLLALTTHARNGYREPHQATVYSEKSFANLFAGQPWKSVSTWYDGRYQYALCQKS